MIKAILLLGVLGLLTSCNQIHEGVYIYKKRAYTTQNISDFEMQNFKDYAKSDKVLVVNSKKEGKEEFVKNSEELCQSKKLVCDFFDITEFPQKEISKLKQKIMQYAEIKFMVIGDGPEAVAFSVGSFSKIHFEADEKELKSILYDVGVADESKLLEKLKN